MTDITPERQAWLSQIHKRMIMVEKGEMAE
jgi:hypothetical protein